MENINTYKLHQTGPETQTILDQVSTNTADIAQLQDLYQAFISSGVTIIQPTDTWPVANPEEKVIYRVIDRVNTPPESYSDYMWNGTTMVLMATYDNAIDSTPTAGSNNPVASGGVLNYVSTNGSAYDISAANSDTAYADLAAALGMDGENVPEAVRKGGMSVKFVQTSDNKYVQYRLMAQSFTTDVTQWQSENVNSPIIGGKDLVQGSDVFNTIGQTVRDKKNIIVLDGATNNEISAYNNVLFIVAYKFDLAGWKLTTVVDTEKYPKRIIITNSVDQIDAFMTSNYYVKNFADGGFVYIGYNWDNHTEDVNIAYSYSKLVISGSIKYNEKTIDKILSLVDSEVSREKTKESELLDLTRDKENISAICAVKKQATITGGNYFDKTNIVAGIIGNDGSIQSNSNYSCSDFISASQGDVIKTSTSNRYLAFYDSSYAIIGSVSIGVSSVTAPESTAYFRVAPSNTSLNTCMVFINENIPSTYYGYGDGPNTKLNAPTNEEFDEVAGETTKVISSEIVEYSSVDSGCYISGNNIVTGASETFKVYEFPVSAGETYILNGDTRLNSALPIAGFKATSGTSGSLAIIIDNTYSNELHSYSVPYTPAENGYIFIAATTYGVLQVNKTIDKHQINIDIEELQEKVEELQEEQENTVFNPWYGKKVVWLGTSVPFGQNATKSYAKEVADYLGFNLVNCAVPGLGIHLDNGHILEYGSLTASIAECEADGMTIPNAPIPWVPGGSYNNYYRTWEHVFTQENADADLWVFDVAPNNTNFGLDDWNAFNKSDWKYNDDSTFASHRNTFIGAILFLMDKMYALNPQARMVFLLGSAFSYVDGKSNFTKMKNQWFMEIVDVYGKINICKPSKNQIYSNGGTNTHPSTFAHELMGRMLIGEFMKIA